MARRLYHGRKFIPEEGIEVHVKGFQWITKDLAVLQYFVEGKRMVDIFNVKEDLDMFILSHAHSDEKVVAFIVPDSSDDSDSHPEIQWTELSGGDYDQPLTTK